MRIHDREIHDDKEIFLMKKLNKISRGLFFLSVFFITISLAGTVLATFCYASNLMLGTLGGSLTKNQDGTYTYYGAAPCSFQCGNGDDVSECRLCVKGECFYTYDFINYPAPGGSPVYGSGDPGAACSTSATFTTTAWGQFSGLKSYAQNPIWTVRISIAPLPSDGTDCTSPSYTLTSFTNFYIPRS